MANKFVTVFLLYIVVVTALHAHEAAADDEKFRSCYNSCYEECIGEGHGTTLCEMKCDNDCSNKEFADKLGIQLDN
ncbi:major pollen allergen Ole e 6-like [Punica granatum]|uniref:Major pollen allergen Ole e 6-like n=2 Tax=Punica granatum TaxID=22663 RepID=A0A6P8E471_PUNGR|nr:major pollen allergen Ole e 6-like [Punica granatum]PKI34463.1 hypothetical protein CRG98_045144 [Punica granatum]